MRLSEHGPTHNVRLEAMFLCIGTGRGNSHLTLNLLWL